jgi:hypothetical protein
MFDGRIFRKKAAKSKKSWREFEIQLAFAKKNDYNKSLSINCAKMQKILRRATNEQEILLSLHRGQRQDA